MGAFANSGSADVGEANNNNYPMAASIQSIAGSSNP